MPHYFPVHIFSLLLFRQNLCSQSRLRGWNVAPLLDNRLLDLPGVLPGPGADLLGDVDALLGGLEEGHQLGDVLARSLGLEVTGLLGHLDGRKVLLYNNEFERVDYS